MKPGVTRVLDYLVIVDDSKLEDGDLCILNGRELVVYSHKTNMVALQKIVGQYPLNNAEPLPNIKIVPELIED